MFAYRSAVEMTGGRAEARSSNGRNVSRRESVHNLGRTTSVVEQNGIRGPGRFVVLAQESSLSNIHCN